MVRTTTLAVAIVLLTLLYGPAPALACSCAPPPPPKKALEGAKAVFVGKVTEIKEDENTFEYVVTFEVQSTYKGVSTKKVQVRTATSGAACGYGFGKGKSYLVYCGGKDQLRASLCSRTKPIEKAKEDIAEIGDGKPPAKKKESLTLRFRESR
jgi:hypothetical protein